jgi:uncharacterized protein (TIGR03435 family)
MVLLRACRFTILVAISVAAFYPYIPESAAQTAASDIKFDVVSVRANRSGGSVGSTANGDGVWIRNLPLRRIVNLAYDIKLGSLVSGLPDWAGSERFDITCKVAESDVPAFTKLGISQRFLMLQPVLEDRFKMKSHFETRELPIYELVLDRNGPKFTQAEFAVGEGGQHEVGMSSEPGEIRAMGVPMDRAIQALSVQLGRVVVDKTGLAGKYAFTLKWTPDTEAAPAAANGDATDVSGPSIFTAVQEQLGLKLESSKGPVKILAIDHVEPPSDN